MKVSLPIPNVANAIAAHVSAAWPELAAVTGVWFTGSQIWSWLYAGPPLAGSDWDIFALDERSAAAVADRLGLRGLPACRTRDKRNGAPRTVSDRHVPVLAPPLVEDDGSPDGTGYSEGYCYATERGELDLWLAEPGGVIAELRSYPSGSHAHCRAAFSFTDGLVVLPNECAASARGEDLEL